MIFVCEDNGFAMSTRSARSTALDQLADRAVGFGFPGVTVDGMDAVATYEVISVAVERARAGQGPTLVVAACHRYEGHSVGDAQDYRDGEEDAAWRERDPVAALRRRLVAAGTLTDQAADGIEAEESRRIAVAIDAADAAPPPDVSEAWTDIHG